ncbi:MAG: DUF503 domain-containing protein [Planctomycetales bacterium]|nr:DUF503 domain-containing protein [Planctomycetales bacterium]
MPFVVGTATLRLALRESHSLKDKRRVVLSLKDRLRQQFNVSVSEVDGQDERQRAVLGVAMAGSDARYVEGALAKVVDLVRGNPHAELVDFEVRVA